MFLKLLTVVLLMIAIAAYNLYLKEQQSRRVFKNTYKQYLPAEITAKFDKYDTLIFSVR